MSWRNDLQDASFKGVRFDVKKITDSIDKALVEHQYAYTSGADIEDLGNQAEEVSLTAVFWGDHYEANLRSLLNVLRETGSGVLVHPVLGRMLDMVLVSCSLDHEAESIDFVEFRLTFKKSTIGPPIFTGSSLFGFLDDLFSRAENLINQVNDVFNELMQGISKVKAYRRRVKAIQATIRIMGNELSGALKGHVLGSVNHAVNQTFHPPLFENPSTFAKDFANAAEEYLESRKVESRILPKTELNSLESSVKEIQNLPERIIKQDTQYDLGIVITDGDIVEVIIVVQTTLVSLLIKRSVEMIEEQDYLTPLDIESIINYVRREAQKLLELIRTLEYNANLNQYDAYYALVCSIREAEHQLKELGASMIAKKPPLIVREVEFNGTLQQIAFYFYNDHKRFDELLQLNPEIKHPNFIEKGTLLNGYAK